MTEMLGDYWPVIILALVLGAIVGAVGGMVIGDVVNQIREHHRAHDEQLDKDIGVTGGDIGAAWDPPPALAGDAVPDEGPSPKAG